MTELLVTPKSLNHIETLIDLGADAFFNYEQKVWFKTSGNSIDNK